MNLKDFSILNHVILVLLVDYIKTENKHIKEDILSKIKNIIEIQKGYTNDY